MYLSLKSRLKLFSAYKRANRFLLNAVMLAPFLLTACGAAKTPTVAQPLILTPIATSSQNNTTPAHTAEPTNTPLPTAAATVVASPTPTLPEVQASTTTVMPTVTVNPTPSGTATKPDLPSVFYPNIPAFYYNMAADIQNHVNGLLQVLNISGENGEAYIIIRNTYIDRSYQYNASYNIVQYLATYFKGLSNLDLAKLFGGTQFTLHIKSISITDEYIVDTITPYAVLAQVAQAQVDQGQWEALVNAQVQIQYHVIALCSVTPNTGLANTDTNLLISAWLTYLGKPVTMQYVTAAWKDSNAVQIYCAGNPYDSTCHGHSGTVKSGSSITIDVGIQADDGLKYTCQTSFSAP